jgi:subtilase family serine protease
LNRTVAGRLIVQRAGKTFLNAVGSPKLILLSAFLLILPGLAAAQGNSARPRVTDRVDEAQLAVLQGNTHPLARTQFDQGSAPPSLPMDRMHLVLKRSPEQEAALRDLLEQQQDKSSPNYHKWLTPDQVGQQFGPADQDIQAVTSWLTSQGFQSIRVSKGRTVIEFSGTAAQVQSALHTEIHKYNVNGESHWANANDPQIPAALAPVVAGVVSLHNFLKKPYLAQSGQEFAITSAPGERPQFRNSVGGNAMGPADFNVIYSVPAVPGNATIAVIGRTNINVQDVRDFRTQFVLPANDPQVILNGPDPGNLGTGEETEAVLDVSWSGAVAPGATVKFVVSESTNSADGTDLSEIYIIDNNLADVMTESFGSCEGSASSGAAAAASALAEQAAAQGITYLVSSGDNGVAGCDDQNVAPATHSASINVLAATPFTVAVGGTQFNENGNPNAYWATSNGAGFKTALSYIPEDVWNESGSVAGGSGLWSSSGGKSIFFTPKPSWQSGVAGIPADGARDVPDVSLTAAGHDPYLLCVRASCTGGSPTFSGISGTSASVQAFGGIMALVVQKMMGVRQGQANYVLYKLAASETLSSCNASTTPGPPAGPCNFYDTTVGNNTVPGLAGFNAGVGYDLATGLGSVNVTNLLTNWGSVVFKGSATTLSLNGGSSAPIIHGTSVPVTITVAAKSPPGTPTGDVSLIATSGAGQGVEGFTLSSGSVTSTTKLLPGGIYTVTAHYAGDATFGASDSTPAISVTVTPEASATTLGIVTSTSTNAPSVVYGSPYILAAAVTNAAAAKCNTNAAGGPACPTGTVTLTDNGAALDGGSFKLNSLGFFEDKTIQLPVGTHNILAAYGGDSSFNTSVSSTDVVTVTKAATAITVSPNPTTVATGGSVTLTATVATQSNATANAQQEPTGKIQFFVGGVAFMGPVTVTGSMNATTKFAQATAALPPSTLPNNGTNSITAQYTGDGNYITSTSPAVGVTVGPGFTISFNPTTVTVPGAGQKGTTTVTVTAQTGFTGTVNFTPSSCSGLPSLTTCSFSPASVNGSGSSLLTILTTAPKTTFVAPQGRPAGFHWLMAGSVVAFVCLFIMLGLFSQRRGVLRLAGVLGFASVMFVCAGCRMQDKGITTPGTPTGNSTVTVTLTGGGVTSSAPFTLTVQ